MTDSNAFAFTKFVPGFDFLKNLTPQASSNGAGVPGWVAPTLDPKEIDIHVLQSRQGHALHYHRLDSSRDALSVLL